MRIQTAIIGKGKAIHAMRTAGYFKGTTLCITNDSDLSRSTPVAVDAPAVTCKRCLKALAELIELVHAEALTQDAARPAAVKPSRRQRSTARRALVVARRQLQRTVRAQRSAAKRVATARPQAARTWLLAAGMDAADAKRYAGSFSRGVSPTTVSLTTIKLRGRVTRPVPVKLYDQASALARLETYRPKDRGAAAKLNRAFLLFADSAATAAEALSKMSALFRAA